MKTTLFIVTIGFVSLSAMTCQAETKTGTARSGSMISGVCANWSPWYTVCTPPIPSGYRITSTSFQLEGDRRCGYWGECKINANGSDKVCWDFRMQGHSEFCGIHPFSGPGNETEHSTGVIRYNYTND
jgi:hypothetical protein